MPRRQLGIGLLLGLLVASLVLGGGLYSVTAHEEKSDELQILIHDSGDATVKQVHVYDLTDADERETFTSIRDNTSRQQMIQDRFVSRMQSQAQNASENTGRPMEITPNPVSVSQSDDGDQGVVTVTCTWSNFAVRSENDTAVRLESTALDGYTAENTGVRIDPPERYTYISASPNPRLAVDDVPSWMEGTTFTDFRVVFTADQPPDPSSDSDGGFGSMFFVGVIIVILAGVVYVFSNQQYP